MRRLLVAFALIAVSAVAAEPPLPPWFPNPGAFSTRDSTVHEAWGEARFRMPKGNDFEWATFRGHHWSWRMFPPGDPKTWATWNPAAAWEKIRSGLERAGFKQIFRKGNDKAFDVTMQKGTTYVSIDMRSDPHDSSGEIVEVAPNPLAISLTAPASKPETFGPKDDFPYLKPLSGSQLARAETYPGPLNIEVEGERGDRLAGTAHMNRMYRPPEGLSRIAFASAYEDALRRAGWTIVKKNAEQGRLFAHFSGNGCDVWTYVRYPGNQQPYDIDVADVGSSLRADLAKNCKASLYGVNFDFDKATLRPDSDAPLSQLLAVLRDDPKLTVEIGGHTDNVGKSDYNLALSGKRAEAVRAWLIAHGIAASRLTSHGYGDTQPLVPNNSDENRAKNRRVEIKKANCR
jgi:outer membrane protein OmpA-like peptidoglycan-associated protein